MKIIDLIQGTSEWHAHRAQHWNASDAPAMLGVSPYKTRAQLIRERATGIVPEVDSATTRRFADGHRFEELARPLAEDLIGEELFPVTGTSGRFSASFDGLTMGQDTGFEHKTLNDELRSIPPEQDGHRFGADLPIHYRVQMEQQLVVSGATSILFMATSWDGDNLAEEPFTAWYHSDAELRAKIVAGWEQFEKDVEAYVPDAPAELVTGNAPESLPALRLELTGMVTSSNLPEFKERALAVFGGIRKDLVTDQDFADAEQTVKFCEDVEKRIAGAKQHALSQTASIDELFRVLDEVSATARRTRLDLDKLVKTRKEERKGELVRKAQSALLAHIGEVNNTLGEYGMAGKVDAFVFSDAIHGKRSFSAMKDALDSVVSNEKIDIDAFAEVIRTNAKLMAAAGGHGELFPDHVSLVQGKSPEDLQNIITVRIADKLQREADRKAEEERVAAEQIKPVEEFRAELDVTVQDSSAPQVALLPDKTINLGKLNELIAPVSVTADGLEKLGFKPVGSDKRSKLYSLKSLPAIVEALRGCLTAALQRAAQE